MDDYKKLAMIYEGYLGNSYDGPSKAYVAGEAPRGQSYKKGQLPVGQDSSGSGRAFDAGLVGQGIVAPISDDEEIVGSPIVDKINELIEKAVDDDMQYAVFALGELKEFVVDYLNTKEFNHSYQDKPN